MYYFIVKDSVNGKGTKLKHVYFNSVPHYITLDLNIVLKWQHSCIIFLNY